MVITFDQFKNACRFNAAHGVIGINSDGVHFPDGPKCRHNPGHRKACFMKRCPLLKPVKPANQIQVVKPTAARFVLEQQRMDYVESHAGRIKHARDHDRLWMQMARDMKGLGLYSQTTYLQDIARGIERRATRLGLFKG